MIHLYHTNKGFSFLLGGSAYVDCIVFNAFEKHLYEETA